MAFFSLNSISDIWKAFIRPPRYLYNDEDLGPEIFHTTMSDILINRIDLQINNEKGITL